MEAVMDSNISPYSTVGKKIVLDTPYFKISENIININNHQGKYWVMDKPSFSICIVLDEQHNILLIKNWRYPINSCKFELPQGVSDSLDPEKTAIREVQEETGVIVHSVQHLISIHEAYGYTNSLCHVFFADKMEFANASPEPLEAIDGVTWCSLDSFWNLVKNGKITDSVSISSIAIAEKEGIFNSDN